MSANIVLALLAIPIVFMSFLPKSHAGNWVCKPCRSQEECDEDPKQYCVYGETKDACGRRVCAKGPGERCGGTLKIFGECNPALMCIDEVCHGCYLSILQEDQFDCYPRMQT